MFGQQRLDGPDVLLPVPGVDAHQALGVPHGVHLHSGHGGVKKEDGNKWVDDMSPHLDSKHLFSHMKKITLKYS